MEIKFINNQISYNNIKINANEYEKICLNLRENYVNWLSNVHTKNWNNKNIIEEFKWKDLSTWWFNNLNNRDAEVNNEFFKKLLIVYLCKYNLKITKVSTDDKLLFIDLKKNFKHIDITFVKNYFNNVSRLKKYFKNLKMFLRFIEIKLILSLLTNKINPHEKKVWFRSTFPANWIGLEKNNFLERQYHELVSNDTQSNFEKAYLIFILRHQKDKNISTFALSKLIKKLMLNYDSKIFFPEKEVSYKDIINIFYSTYIEKRKFYKLLKNEEFLKLFNIDGISLQNILIDEWNKSFNGQMQYSKFHGIAFFNFFKKYKKNQIIVTYGELFTHSKVYYYLTKKLCSKHLFISVQHAINSKNKIQSYFRKNEYDKKFTFGNKASPAPDYLMLQGKQYFDIASEFFDKDKLKIIGPLKYRNFTILKKNQKTISINVKNNYKFIKKNNILIAPSVNDVGQIINVLKRFRIPNDWSLILKPHPSQNKLEVSEKIHKNLAHLNIKVIDNENIMNLVIASDLVISGYSSVAVESLYFKKVSIRFGNFTEFPLFDFDSKIPTFYESKSFQLWFDNSFLINKKRLSENDNIFEYFFSKNISNSFEMFWDFINNNLD